MNQKKVIRFAAGAAALAVIAGAFGAHELSSLNQNGTLSDDDMKAFETAVRYQFFHALALLILPALSAWLPDKYLKTTAFCFRWGIVLFCGSLYILSLSPLVKIDINWIGIITPVGGLFFIAGWIFLFAGTFGKLKS